MSKEEIIQTYKIKINKDNEPLEINFEILKHEIHLMDLVLEDAKDNYKTSPSPTLSIEKGSIIMRWRVNSMYNKEFNITDKKENIFGHKTSEIYLEVKRLNKILRGYKTVNLSLSKMPNSELSLNYIDVDVFEILNEEISISDSTTRVAFEIFKKLRKENQSNYFENLIVGGTYEGENTKILLDGIPQKREVNINKQEAMEIYSNVNNDDASEKEILIESRTKEKVKVSAIPRDKNVQSLSLEFDVDGVKQKRTHEYEKEIIINKKIAHDYAEVDYEIYGDKNNRNKKVKVLKIRKVYSNLNTEEQEGPKFYSNFE